MKILHINTEANFEKIKERFESEGNRFEVLTVNSSQGAIERIEGRDIDCVITGLPQELEISELIQVLRSKAPETPVILFTADGSEQIASQAINAGVNQYIVAHEPTSIDKLNEAVQQVTSFQHRFNNDDSEVRTHSSDIEEKDSRYSKEYLQCLQSIVETVTEAFQYSEHAAAMIQTDYFKITGPDYASSEWELTARHVTTSGTQLTFNVAYLEHPPVNDEPFLDAEKDLIVNIARILRESLEYREMLQEHTYKNSCLDELLDRSPAIVYIKRATGEFCLVNKTFRSVMPIPDTEVIGRKAVQVFGESEVPDLFEEDEGVVSSGETIERVDNISTGEVVRKYRTKKTPIFDPMYSESVDAVLNISYPQSLSVD